MARGLESRPPVPQDDADDGGLSTLLVIGLIVVFLVVLGGLLYLTLAS